MFKKKGKLFILLVVLLSISFVGCSSSEKATAKLTYDDWVKQELVWPEWAKPSEVELDEDIKYARISTRGDIDIEAVQEKISQLRFLMENTESSEEYPMYYYWMYSLADGLLKVGENHLAHNYLTTLIELPEDTIVMESKRGDKLKKYTKVDAHMEDTIQAMILKILALEGYNEEFMAMYKDIEYNSVSDASAVAFTLGLIGDKEEAYKIYEYASNPENFKGKYPIKTTSTNINAAAYAYINGDYDKVFELTERFITKGIDSTDSVYFEGFENSKSEYPKRQWTASFKQTEAYRELAEMAKNGQVANFENLKDGEYTGSVISYMQTPVDIEITVKDGKVTNISVIQDGPQDDRSGGAFDIVSQRIVDEQSTDIDIVSGATISSEAVRIGVLEALLKAK